MHVRAVVLVNLTHEAQSKSMCIVAGSHCAVVRNR